MKIRAKLLFGCAFLFALFFTNNATFALSSEKVLLKMATSENSSVLKIKVDVDKGGEIVPANDTSEKVKVVIGRLDNLVSKSRNETSTDKDGIIFVDLKQLYKEDKTLPNESYVEIMPLMINDTYLDGSSESLEFHMSGEVFSMLEKEISSSISEEEKMANSSTTTTSSVTGESQSSSKVKVERTAKSLPKNTVATTAEKEKLKLNLWAIFLSLFILLLVAADAIYLLRKRKAKQQEEELMEFFEEHLKELQEHHQKRRMQRNARR